MKLCLLIPLLALLTLARPASAWDPLGHMLISQIAEDQLTPEARTKVAAAMAAFNEKEKADYDFVTAACWMDDIRARTREYNSWHYVTLPFTQAGEPVPEGSSTSANVVWAARQCVEKLRSDAPAAEKAEALVMLLHLEGDVHQPLHATDNRDQGGNRREVSNLKNPEVDLLFSKGTNLHYFWDSAYRRTFEAGDISGVEYATPLHDPDQPLAGHKDALPLVREQASAIVAEFPKSVVPSPGEPESWALESHRIGFDFAYGKLPKRHADRTYKLTKQYVEEARAISRKQVAIAGYRLGDLLNSIYGK